MNDLSKKWWKEAVVYQIYPRSFKDSNGDGIGDLRGIIEKLDYIKSLGVDVVWLNPIFKSPNDDNGYDVSDYREIMDDFGNMNDFDEMLAGFHERGIKVVLDLVVNHSSDEHFWFQEAKKSRENPYRNYYHWWNAEDGKPPKRWSFFDVNGDAWKYDETTNSYYLHIFSEKQPDLNWENPKLRQEVYDIVKFWFDKGIDGFRMDVITFISKDLPFKELPEKYNGDFVQYYAEGPHLHEYLREFNREVLSKYDIMTVAEGPGTTVENVLNFVGEDRNELNMSYHFDISNLGHKDLSKKLMASEGWNFLEFKEIFKKWDDVFAEKGWGTVYLGNHDFPRMVSRWGNDSEEWREVSSKMLTTFLLTMRGTVYYYFGDEIGMTNIRFEKLEDYRDIMTINLYKLIEAEDGDLDEFMESQKLIARDNGRTPFQWNSTENAGFSSGNPWLKVNPNYTEINAEAQEKDENSVLNYFRKMIRFRKENEVLIYGKTEYFDMENESVFAYTREFDGRKMLVLINFKKTEAEAKTGIEMSKTKVVFGNYSESSTDGKLKPYEAVIYELTE
ncbi:MAG TPA: alpha-glucosidase [Pyrinomonadaceae bacterium]|nr:alpha-glucosidase [Pyrinomonadaceae bacterium]